MTLPTVQDFHDGKRDLDDLELINESEIDYVTTRGGKQRPTLSKLSRALDDLYLKESQINSLAGQALHFVKLSSNVIDLPFPLDFAFIVQDSVPLPQNSNFYTIDNDEANDGANPTLTLNTEVTVNSIIDVYIPILPVTGGGSSTSSFYLTPYDFDAAGNGVDDDSDALEAYLMSGGWLRGAPGVFRITRPIYGMGITNLDWPSSAVGTGGYTFGYTLEGMQLQAARGAGIIFVDPNGWTNPNNEDQAIVFRDPNHKNMPSVAIQNFLIMTLIDNPAPVGLLRFEAPYDNLSLFNVNALFGDDNKHIVEVLPNPNDETSVVQSVNIQGLNAIGSTGGNRVAATVKLRKVQEGTIDSSKAFGSPYRVDTENNNAPLYSTNPCWEIDDSRGLNFNGASAAISLGSGFKFIATNRSCQYHVMNGCTYELVGSMEEELIGTFSTTTELNSEGLNVGWVAIPGADLQIGDMIAISSGDTPRKIIGKQNSIYCLSPSATFSGSNEVYRIVPFGSAVEIFKNTENNVANITINDPRIEAPVGHFLWSHKDDSVVSDGPVNITAKTLGGYVHLEDTVNAEIYCVYENRITELNSSGVNKTVIDNSNYNYKVLGDRVAVSGNSCSFTYTNNPNDVNDYYRSYWSADPIVDQGFIWRNNRAKKHLVHATNGDFSVNDGVDSNNTVNKVIASPARGFEHYRTVSPSMNLYAGDNAEYQYRATYNSSTAYGRGEMNFRFEGTDAIMTHLSNGDLKLDGPGQTGNIINDENGEPWRQTIDSAGVDSWVKL